MRFSTVIFSIDPIQDIVCEQPRYLLEMRIRIFEQEGRQQENKSKTTIRRNNGESGGERRF